MKTILITNARSPMTLELARHFNQIGLRVVVTDTSRFPLSHFSKAVKRSYKTPSPRFHPDEFIETLRKISEDEKISMIIPTFEEIFTLAKYKEKFPSSCDLFLSSFETLHRLHNKYLFNKRLEELGFLSPCTHLIKESQELKALPFTSSYILKPSYSRSASNLYLVHDPFNLPDIPLKPHNPYLAQEYLEGDKLCTYSICRDGRLLAHTTYPVRFAIQKSSCITFEAIDHPPIKEWVLDFVEKENFTGHIAFDFIETKEKELYAIECNPRCTFGLHLFSKREKIAEKILGTSEGYVAPPIGSRRQIAMGMLLWGWRKKHHGQSFTLFLKHLFTTKDTVFSLKDLKPFLIQPFLFLNYIKESLRLKLSLPALFTYEVDWNNE